MDNVVQIINNVGFPIACCIALMWYLKYITDRHASERKEILDQTTASIDKLRESHEQETDNIVEAIHNNTLIMTKLYEKLYVKNYIIGGGSGND